MSGEPGRVAGADFAASLEPSVEATKSWVSQISHSASDGWFRNVHAGQATEAVGWGWIKEDDETTELEGRDIEKCCGGGDCVAEGRTTPQSSQSCVLEGLRSDACLFLFPQTSHSQMPGPVWRSWTARSLSPLRARCKVILGEEVKRPA